MCGVLTFQKRSINLILSTLFANNDKIGKYNFKGGYNLHGFMDLNLSKEDKNFLENKDIIDAGAFTGDTAIPLSEVTHKMFLLLNHLKSLLNY